MDSKETVGKSNVILSPFRSFPQFLHNPGQFTGKPIWASTLEATSQLRSSWEGFQKKQDISFFRTNILGRLSGKTITNNVWLVYCSSQRLFIRRLLGTILTVYIPTLLLIIISHMTNYFKPFFFEAVVTVNLTVLLVLATMFISVSENLPKTSYIKMVDVWLIFNLMIPFFEVTNLKSKI